MSYCYLFDLGTSFFAGLLCIISIFAVEDLYWLDVMRTLRNKRIQLLVFWLGELFCNVFDVPMNIFLARTLL
ncbi:Metal transporter cnnm-4, partial [Bienertia sinuspersici]